MFVSGSDRKTEIIIHSTGSGVFQVSEMMSETMFETFKNFLEIKKSKRGLGIINGAFLKS